LENSVRDRDGVRISVRDGDGDGGSVRDRDSDSVRVWGGVRIRVGVRGRHSVRDRDSGSVRVGGGDRSMGDSCTVISVSFIVGVEARAGDSVAQFRV
jgi:hypothetical protein